MAEQTANVFIVDDDASVRRGLARLLGANGYRTQTFASARELLESGVKAQGGCIILDLKMPDIDGMQLQQRLVDAGINVSIVFLTGHGDLATGVQAMKQGAVDFLTKPVDEQTLLAAVREALGLQSERQAEHALITAVRERLVTLSPREREVMDAVVRGALNKQIAAQLGISEKTVKVHRGHVMEKMHVSSLAELVQLCAKAGLV
ncbi:MAG: hypothetical protein AMJ69_09825 [Gammaproteobacteria bacterium SG8_47]|nr:MAG: hypothetical protein AMJ69_09825 [Gammaproteobacteria bacterium SG8_47]